MLEGFFKDLQHVTDAIAAIAPTLTEKEQKSLSSRTMGRDSIPFAQQVGQVLAGFKQVLSRRITDDTITAYPQWLALFAQITQPQALAEALAKLALLAGASIMEVGRQSYDDVKEDNGRTPGLRDLEQKLALCFKGNGVPKAPKPPKP